MIENDSVFEWSEASYRAAQLLAEDELADIEIAEEVNIGTATLYRWKKHPDFKAKIQEIAEQIGAAIVRRAITKRGRRIKALEDRWNRMQRLIAERAADIGSHVVPGGSTGLLVCTVKAVNGATVEEWHFDAALLKEIRETEKQAAQEAGQWADKHEHTGEGGEPIKIIEVVLPTSNGHATNGTHPT